MLVLRLHIHGRVNLLKTQENLSQNSEVLICPEYAIFAVRVKLPATTSATPTVKREEPSRQTFRRYPTLKTVRKRPATYARDVLKRQTEHKFSNAIKVKNRLCPSGTAVFSFCLNFLEPLLFEYFTFILKLTKIKRTRFRMANFALYFVKIFVKSFRFDRKFCLV